jgi:hypothetical protein
MAQQSLDRAPEWFKQALAVPNEQRSVEVDGAWINYLVWENSAPQA